MSDSVYKIREKADKHFVSYGDGNQLVYSKKKVALHKVASLRESHDDEDLYEVVEFTLSDPRVVE